MDVSNQSGRKVQSKVYQQNLKLSRQPTSRFMGYDVILGVVSASTVMNVRKW